MISAYVCGEKEGLLLENPYHMGETLNGTTGLDIDNEIRLVHEKLKELRAEEASERAITLALKDFGLKRFVRKKSPELLLLSLVCSLKHFEFFRTRAIF